MRMSQLFAQPSKTVPADAETVNHRLLVQAGFVDQLMAGVFTYLPLGLRVIEKISRIIREEMNAVGGQEIHMPALHPAANWKTTGGWNSVDVLFKLKSRTDKEYALGQSHEEVVTPLMKQFIKSYRDLPRAVYQIQWKFRDELRAKSGIMRGREFLMKDMYSFHETQTDLDRFYQEVKQAYIRAFSRMGLTAKVTEASGGNFSEKISYEFMVLTDAGEDVILYCNTCDYCINTEIAKGMTDCLKCKTALSQGKASEVGNVFDLGQKYTTDFDVRYTTADGKSHYPIMGCYGFGITRTMGAIVEKCNDAQGIIWPESVAPCTLSLVTLDNLIEESQVLYQELTQQGLEVLWDDRDASAGTKLANADLIGNPYRVVVSNKSLQKGGFEIKARNQKENRIITKTELIEFLQ